MWWWRKVRKAQIKPSERELFERHGETVVALLLAADRSSHPSNTVTFGRITASADDVTAWLVERADIHERREQRLEMVEWAVLIFVVFGVIVDILLLVQRR
jgi:hypothetical protein